MFGRNRKSKPVLTKSFCLQLECLRTAIEVLRGSWVKFIEMDFNTGNGKVRTLYEEYDIMFIFKGERTVNIEFDFKLGYMGWHRARFDQDTQVRVTHKTDPERHAKTDHAMCWVGYSAKNRRQVPVFPECVEDCARQYGLSVEEYLKP